jgi:hypothetical protein
MGGGKREQRVELFGIEVSTYDKDADDEVGDNLDLSVNRANDELNLGKKINGSLNLDNDAGDNFIGLVNTI